MTSCLLIIDVQKGLVNEHTKDIPSKVEALQSQYEFVFICRFVNPPHSPHRELLKWNKFGADSPEAELAFEPSASAEIFTKGIYSCAGEDFLRRLEQRGISEVHLCGMDTNCCILKTAADLFERGYRPVVLSQASASHSGKEYHEAGLKLLVPLIGKEQIV